MVLIHTALKCEALPLVEHFRLKKIKNGLYANDKISLVTLGVGAKNTERLAEILGEYKFGKVLNIGICGCRDEGIKIGEIFCVAENLSVLDRNLDENSGANLDIKANADFSKKSCMNLDENSYVNLNGKWDNKLGGNSDENLSVEFDAKEALFKRADIECVDEPKSSINVTLCDMESDEFIRICKSFGVKFASLKIVSDHLKTSHIDKNFVYNLIKNQIKNIEKVVNE